MGNPPILRIEEGTAGILKVMRSLRVSKQVGIRQATVMHRVKKVIELPIEF